MMVVMPSNESEHCVDVLNVIIMNNQVFVPVTDDIIYEHPEMIEGPLIPYLAGMECHEWLSIEINPDETSTPQASRRTHKVANASKLRLAYSA